MNCIICSSAKKYKCKQCNAPYCSVQCYKKHNQVCDRKPKEQIKKQPIIQIIEDPVIKTDYVSDEELRLNKAQLQRLSQSSRIKDLLKDSNLREKLIAIDNSKQRMTSVQQAMGQENFFEFFKAVIQVIQPGKIQNEW